MTLPGAGRKLVLIVYRAMHIKNGAEYCAERALEVALLSSCFVDSARTHLCPLFLAVCTVSPSALFAGCIVCIENIVVSSARTESTWGSAMYKER